MKKSKPKKPKNTPVTRAFLMKLANDIYNPKTKEFLRLCDGTLQNGPDPTDASRPMHCGLGELYFAMTGLQPQAGKVNEDQVIEMAIKRSGLSDKAGVAVKRVNAAIKKIASTLPPSLKEGLLELELEKIDGGPIDRLDTILREIPTENDDNCGDECDIGVLRERSRRVSGLFRDAASLL